MKANRKRMHPNNIETTGKTYRDADSRMSFVRRRNTVNSTGPYPQLDMGTARAFSLENDVGNDQPNMSLPEDVVHHQQQPWPFLNLNKANVLLESNSPANYLDNKENEDPEDLTLMTFQQNAKCCPHNCQENNIKTANDNERFRIMVNMLSSIRTTVYYWHYRMIIIILACILACILIIMLLHFHLVLPYFLYPDSATSFPMITNPFAQKGSSNMSEYFVNVIKYNPNVTSVNSTVIPENTNIVPLN